MAGNFSRGKAYVQDSIDITMEAIAQPIHEFSNGRAPRPDRVLKFIDGRALQDV